MVIVLVSEVIDYHLFGLLVFLPNAALQYRGLCLLACGSF
jgi:hypothetical protein